MDEGQQNESGATGASEAVAVEPSHDDIAELYAATGVKAPVPTGKPKGRPKTATVRAEDSKKDAAGDTGAGKQKDGDDEGKSKNASAPDGDDNSGDKADAKGKKVGKDAESVLDESKATDAGVRKPESGSKEDAERGSKDSAEQGDERLGQAADDETSAEEARQAAEEGKRPGKSNPEVEKRFQKLTGEVKERDQLIEDLQKQLREKEQAVEQSKVAQEDPEYTLADFQGKVRDEETGEIIELNANQAELAWRRWKDGFDQRAEERQAEVNRKNAVAEQEAEKTRELMDKSVKAYDTLAGLMDEYPELVSTSGKFDDDFASEAMPIIAESIDYLEGTEPGNAEGNTPVIVGLKIHPKKILDALKNISNKKRSLPLNGINDNVESRSNVSVPHSRSSDPTVQRLALFHEVASANPQSIGHVL